MCVFISLFCLWSHSLISFSLTHLYHFFPSVCLSANFKNCQWLLIYTSSSLRTLPHLSMWFPNVEQDHYNLCLLWRHGNATECAFIPTLVPFDSYSFSLPYTFGCILAAIWSILCKCAVKSIQKQNKASTMSPPLFCTCLPNCPCLPISHLLSPVSLPLCVCGLRVCGVFARVRVCICLNAYWYVHAVKLFQLCHSRISLNPYALHICISYLPKWLGTTGSPYCGVVNTSRKQKTTDRIASSWLCTPENSHVW